VVTGCRNLVPSGLVADRGGDRWFQGDLGWDFSGL
jgi:hypothetical protein